MERKAYSYWYCCSCFTNMTNNTSFKLQSLWLRQFHTWSEKNTSQLILVGWNHCILSQETLVPVLTLPLIICLSLSLHSVKQLMCEHVTKKTMSCLEVLPQQNTKSLSSISCSQRRSQSSFAQVPGLTLLKCLLLKQSSSGSGTCVRACPVLMHGPALSQNMSFPGETWPYGLLNFCSLKISLFFSFWIFVKYFLKRILNNK